MNPGEKFDQQLCFNASENKNIIIYALFPGQKIFVSVFHPMSISPHLELTGRIENDIFRNRRQKGQNKLNENGGPQKLVLTSKT